MGRGSVCSDTNSITPPICVYNHLSKILNFGTEYIQKHIIDIMKCIHYKTTFDYVYNENIYYKIAEENAQ